MQQRRDHQSVAALVIELTGQPVGRSLRRNGMQAEALGNSLPDRGALEEIKRARPARDGVHRAR